MNKWSIEVERKRFSQITRVSFNLRDLGQSWIHCYTLITTYICTSTEPFESVALSYKKLWRFFRLFNFCFLVNSYRIIEFISWLRHLIFWDVYNTFTTICIDLICLRYLWLLVQCGDLSCLTWVFFCSEILCQLLFFSSNDVFALIKLFSLTLILMINCGACMFLENFYPRLKYALFETCLSRDLNVLVQ